MAVVPMCGVIASINYMNTARRHEREKEERKKEEQENDSKNK